MCKPTTSGHDLNVYFADSKSDEKLQWTAIFLWHEYLITIYPVWVIGFGLFQDGYVSRSYVERSLHVFYSLQVFLWVADKYAELIIIFIR